MDATSRNTWVLGLTGAIFLVAGLRDRYWPGYLTLNGTPPSRQDIGIAMTLGMFFLAVAAFTATRSKRQS